PRTLHAEPHSAGHRQAMIAQSLKAGHINSLAPGVQLELAGGEIIVTRGDNFSRVLAHRYRSQFDDLASDAALRPDARQWLAVDAPFVQFDPAGALQRADWPVGLHLCI